MSESRSAELADAPFAQPSSRCPSCGSAVTTFYQQDSVPVHSCRLLPSKVEARRFPRGELRLSLCGTCGFITNTAFDSSLQDYAADYEETQIFSPRYRAFMSELAETLIRRHALMNKTILEIGCGKGDFLALLCELGPNRGIGIDPSFVPERLTSQAVGRIRFIRDLYSERYVNLGADFVVCRHTLEHIGLTGEFMKLALQPVAARRDAGVFFELPDTLRILREGAFWDMYYEHCSYFTPGSLARLFRLSGLEVMALELAYDGQYILIEGRPSDGTNEIPLGLEESPQDVATAAAEFRIRVERVQAYWRQEVADVLDRGGRAVVWGAGSKAVAFLNTLGLADEIEVAVDVNPHKQGTYIAGTGQKIVPPAYLVDYRPQLVIAMNPIYQVEISHELDRLGVRTRLLPA